MMVPPLLSIMQQQPPQRPQAESRMQRQQQHRSQSVSKALPPTRSVSFLQQQQPQRSASTARASSNVRGGGGGVAAAAGSSSGGTQQQHHSQQQQQQQQRGVRHRDFPTRIYPDLFQQYDDNDDDDPDQVARAILKLRERREQQPRSSSSSSKQQHLLRSSSSSNNNPDPNNHHRSNSRGSRERDEPHNPPPPRKQSFPHRSVSAPRQPQQQQQSTTTTTTATAAPKRTVQNYLSPRSSPEEERATACIQQAEDKIDGLLQELEDLRFLEEIDLQDTAGSPPAAPPPPPPFNSNNNHARSQSVPKPREHQMTTLQQLPLKTPRGDMIPVVVRAISPLAAVIRNNHGGRLPPPPPPVTTAAADISASLQPPSMVQLLSPRRISRMDRLALELETQTLCRKVDVLRKEKITLEKAVEMYELSLQGHERDEGMVKQLEQDLRTVRTQLQQAKQDLIAVREQVCADYEDRLHENLAKLQRTQAAADQYQQERNALQQQLDQLRQDFRDSKQKWKDDDARNRSKQQAKEVALELQLQGVTDLADEFREQLEGEKAVVRQLGVKLKEEIAARDADIAKLKEELRQQKTVSKDQVRLLEQDVRKRLSDKNGELTHLRNNLRQSEQALEATKSARDEAHEVRVSSLQEQLSLQQDKYKKADSAVEEAMTKLREQSKQTQQYKNQCSEQADLIKDMTDRLDSAHTEYRNKFDELKEAYEGKETRRLGEMVQEHAMEVDEYERRLGALQEQLAHQNDRHHAEIEQKKRDMEEKLEMHNKAKRELESDHGQILTAIEEKLANLRRDYEQADAERRLLRQELNSLPSKEDDLKERQERDSQDILRENEISHLREKSERLMREITVKDSKLQDLSNKLLEAERTHAAKQAQIETQHANAMFEHKEKSSERVKAMQSSEAMLLEDLERKDADLVELKTVMGSRVSELQDGLNRAKKDMEVARRLNEESEAKLRADISVLTDKLREATSGLKLKCEAINEFEEKLSVLTNQTIESAEDHRTEVQRLHGELRDLSSKFALERTDLNAKLLNEKTRLREEADLVSKLEGMLSNANSKEGATEQRFKELELACREAKAELIAERTRHESAEEQMRVDMAVIQGKLWASEASLKEKRETIEELEDKLRRIADESSSTNKELQKEVDQLRTEVRKLNDLMEKDRAELFTKDDLLGQQQKKLRQYAEDITTLDNAAATSTQMEEDRSQSINELKAALDQTSSELASERARYDSFEKRVGQQLVSIEAKLRDGETMLQQKCGIIADLEEKLRLTANKSSASAKELQEEIENQRQEIQSVNKLLDEERLNLQKKNVQMEELETQRGVLLEQVHRLEELESSVSVTARCEKGAREDLESLQTLYDQSTKALEAEQKSRREMEARMGRSIAELEEQLRASNSSLDDKKDAIQDLEVRLRRAYDETATSTEELESRVSVSARSEKGTREELDSLQILYDQSTKALEAEQNSRRELKGQLRCSIAELEEKLRVSNSSLNDKEDAIKELTVRLKRAYDETATSIEELESRVSVIALSEKVARNELESLQSLYDQSAKALEAEQNSRRELESQMCCSIAEFEEKLKVSNSSLDDKKDAIKDLEVRLRRAYDESASSTMELESELSSLKRELKMSEELLNNERTAMDAKVEEYEQLKVLNWNMRQKVARVETLNSTIADLHVSLSKAENQNNDQAFELTTVNTSLIKDLEGKLDLERRGKEDLMVKLAEIEADLEIKEHQLSRLPTLQAQLKLLVDGREELQAQFGRVEAELERKDKQISLKSERIAALAAELQAGQAESNKSQEALQKQLRLVETELATKSEQANRQIDGLKAKLEAAEKENALQRRQRSIISGELSADAQAKVEQLTRTKASLEAKIRELEEDREDRETQVKESSERYSNQILELQMKVEELTRMKISLKSRLSRVEADLENKDELMIATSSQLSGDLSVMQSTLGERLAENETLKAEVHAMEAKLSDNETAKEIQAKLDAESKEKRSLLSKIGDIEAELLRKEKQIKDIVDRYTRDIAELEYKLEDELMSKTALQRDVDKLKRGDLCSTGANETRLAKEQVERALIAQQRANAALQVELEQLKSNIKTNSQNDSEDKLLELAKANTALQGELETVKAAAEKSKKRLEEQLVEVMSNGDTSTIRTELEEKLYAVEKSKAELEERLKKVNGERTEVITALEEVINEVQSREEEIESLANILRKRDDELEHAKLIATKALASAQEIKARYRSRDGDRQADLSQKIAELNSNVDFLSKKNDSLERKTSRMERELQEREMECSKLRDKLHRIGNGKANEIGILDDEKKEKEGKVNFQTLNTGFATFETSSPTTNASSLAFNDTMSTQSAELQGTAGWLHDFDSQSTDSEDDAASFTGIRTEPSELQSSRRSIERDALRKYVRKRYMKNKGSM